jgi:hypothetical protein
MLRQSKDRIMPHPKDARPRRRMRTVPVLGAAGLSLALANGTPAAIGSANPDPVLLLPAAWQAMDEEEIFEVSLATFHVFDDGSGGTRKTRTPPIRVGQGACGADLYYPQRPPAASAQVYQTPLPSRSGPIRQAYKYRRSYPSGRR